MVSDKQQQLVNTLKELFMMDQADLNFGIYRIMNAKHDDIESFLTNDLLASIRQTLQATGKLSDTKKELDDAIKSAQALGMNPDDSPKVQELKALLGDGAEDSLEKDENEIFSQLTTFFSRYYDGGDFMSLRRYKKETYSPLPMNGEEVKLHWANADQYYIKSAENFSQYAFKIGEENQKKQFRFELVAASTEQNNTKATEGKERRFILDKTNPLAIKQTEAGNELLIHFSYQADAKKRKQKDLNLAAIKFLSSLEANNPLIKQITDWAIWQSTLLSLAPTEKNKTRTALEKHLNDYTAKNSFDYFIHKDLGGFLRRELDFFIKNELLLLDDIVPSSIDTLQNQLLSNERSLKKVIAFKSIAEKLIAFLAQLENFQKKLWLKKKFVQESHYCMTLDRVPERFYQEIARNDKQAKEWQSLGFTTENTNITVDFLKENPYLLIDTALFSTEFKYSLLAEIDDLDESTDGLLIHSENFQALNLLQERYREQVKCVYIDPPYNTGQDGFLYKDAFKSSTWASMIGDRLALSRDFLSNNGVIFTSINKIERDALVWQLRAVFGLENRIEELIWAQDTVSNNAPTYSTNHEYIEAFAKNHLIIENEQHMFRETRLGFREIIEIIENLAPSYAPINEIEESIKNLYKKHRIEYLEKAEILGQSKEEAKKSDPWKGLYPYKHVEFRDAQGKYVPEELRQELSAKPWVWREVEPSMPSGKQAETTKKADSPNYRFYQPLHPVTGNPCKPPKRGWAFPEHPIKERPSYDGYIADNRIWFKDDETTIPQLKYFLHEVETVVSTSVVRQYADGEPQLERLFGRKELVQNPKPPALIEKLVRQTTNGEEVVFDYFAGSGTTAHATINLNREDKGKRKYILVEMGYYFNTVLKPRIKKAAYSGNWKDGKPLANKDGNFNSISHCFKYLRLESYEDAQDNLQLQRSATQTDLLDKPENKTLKDDYLLHYMLDIEAQDSLLSPELFVNPFNATMRVVRDNESRTQIIDLVETFNYLLGLRIKTYRYSKGIVEVTGKNPHDQQVLILWRDCVATNNDALDDWFKKQHYNSRDMEFDLIYVNGDNNLPNLRTGEEIWKVQLIEEIFQTLMFDVKDI